MVYVDTSIFVAILTREDTMAMATGWLETQPTGSIGLSQWVVAEFSSSLSRKIRTGRLSVREQQDALATFSETIVLGMTTLEVGHLAFVQAARIADHYESGLRAGDALHLAIAAANDMPLATLDKRLAAGAARLGYAVELLA